jgi:hypothetical protein
MQSLLSTLLTSTLALAVGFWLGTLYPYAFSGVTDSIEGAVRTAVSPEVGEPTDESVDTAEATEVTNQEPTTEVASPTTLVTGNPEETAFTITVADLPEVQQQALRTVGIEDATLVITNAMVACIEASVGVDRMLEIKNGSGVSVTEGFTLARCYTTN